MDKKVLGGMTALVTGAAKRIGRQIALSLASEGVNVIVHYRRSREEAAELCAQLAGLGVMSWAVEADFDKPGDSEMLMARAFQTAGPIDILINSASVFSPATLAELDFDDLTRNLRINAWAPFVFCRDFGRLAGRGKIVNLLDTRIVGTDPAHVGYILSKHVLYLLTRLLAIELAPGISVNAVAPGLILPPAGKDERYLDQLAPLVPLQRHGDPGDIVEAILYLLRCDFVTGQVIYVDGGRHLKEFVHGHHPD
jgi:pteridine reductase